MVDGHPLFVAAKCETCGGLHCPDCGAPVEASQRAITIDDLPMDEIADRVAREFARTMRLAESVTKGANNR